MDKKKKKGLTDLQYKLKEMFKKDHTLLLIPRFKAVIAFYQEHFQPKSCKPYYSWEFLIPMMEDGEVPHFLEVDRDIRKVIELFPQFKKNSAWLTKQEVSRKYGEHYKKENQAQGEMFN